MSLDTLVDELLHARPLVGLGRVDVAGRVDRDAVHREEHAGLASAVAERGQHKYRRPGRPVYLVAVECSRRKRNLTAFDVEPA